MPTYQYACTECGEHLEMVQSFSDEPLTVCPACQGRLRKVFNSVGVVFKGSGFYRNDSRKAPTTAESPSESKSSESKSSESKSADTKSSDSGSTTKTDSKPAATSSTSSSSSSSSTS
ncbi:FmdB family zinc ribbon protein [Actinoplanes sp. NPDC051470]|uniref:FmdB family zinc ribbon protein n=1 Tax=Actinoplanes sp. NPDC051470 TaxID=3157224 RepID=UPI00343B024B